MELNDKWGINGDTLSFWSDRGSPGPEYKQLFEVQARGTANQHLISNWYVLKRVLEKAGLAIVDIETGERI